MLDQVEHSQSTRSFRREIRWIPSSIYKNGPAKISIVSQTGKEATITILAPGDFAGEESLTATHPLRLVMATAITACSALKINREEMIRVMREEREFSELFLKCLLDRSIPNQVNLVDQFFNSSENAFAAYSPPDGAVRQTRRVRTYIPKASQEAPAEMIGTTGSRVSFFMNRFRKLGLIDFDDRIQVPKSLLGWFCATVAGRHDQRSIR